MTHAPVLLVLDSEPNTLELIDGIVRPLGFTTVPHHDSVGAVNRLAEERPDIALVDVDMPLTGGLEILRTIRRVRPECAVILMTRQPSVDAAIEAVKLGALDYLTKPLDASRLRQRLADAREVADRRAALPLPCDSPTDLASVEREHISRVLAQARGNKVAAAKRLGISRRTLYRRLEHHGLLRALPGRAR
jgi:two-component system response regulator RegA